MIKSIRLGAAASVVLLCGCMNLNVGMMPAQDVAACASCDEEARRADYLEQIRRSGFLATRDDALTTAGEVRSTELK
jgi:hypothetical protein